MITSGLVNQKRGGGFQKGYPHERDPHPNEEFIRPYVAEDKTILTPSSFSKPQKYKAVVPAPVEYNHIFGKKTTADERLYILKQIQQGLEKVEKGILAAPPRTGVPPPIPTTETQGPQQPTIPLDPNPPDPNFTAPLTQPEDQPMVEDTPDTDGIDDEAAALVKEEEISYDVVEDRSKVMDTSDEKILGFSHMHQIDIQPEKKSTLGFNMHTGPTVDVFPEFTTGDPAHLIEHFGPKTAQIQFETEIKEDIKVNGTGPRSRRKDDRPGARHTRFSEEQLEPEEVKRRKKKHEEEERAKTEKQRQEDEVSKQEEAKRKAEAKAEREKAQEKKKAEAKLRAKKKVEEKAEFERRKNAEAAKKSKKPRNVAEERKANAEKQEAADQIQYRVQIAVLEKKLASRTLSPAVRRRMEANLREAKSRLKKSDF